MPAFPTPYRWTLGVFLLVVAATWWRPPHPAEQALHHSLTVLGLVALVIVQRRRPLPYSSFLLILIFLVLHSVAARWIYSFVPYDDWLQQVLGIRLSEVFGWRRNNFDRLVHLTYGLCFGPVLFRLLRERGTRSIRRAALVAVDVVLSTSAAYELFEWGIAMALAPGAAEAYNGQQGDMWDAQKDMSLATGGAMFAVTVAALLAYRSARRTAPITTRAGHASTPTASAAPPPAGPTQALAGPTPAPDGPAPSLAGSSPTGPAATPTRPNPTPAE